MSICLVHESLYIIIVLDLLDNMKDFPPSHTYDFHRMLYGTYAIANMDEKRNHKNPCSNAPRSLNDFFHHISWGKKPRHHVTVLKMLI